MRLDLCRQEIARIAIEQTAMLDEAAQRIKDGRYQFMTDFLLGS
jgi:hypothetical protein